MPPWIAAGMVMLVSVLSTFTLSDAGDRVATGLGGIGEFETGAGAPDVGAVDASGVATGGSGGASGIKPGTARGTGQAGVGPGPGAGARPSDLGQQAAVEAGVDPDLIANSDCAKGENAGATDIGVTDKEIHLAATVVKTGIAKDFLADSQFGIEAVRQKVNRAGGICGRLLTIAYEDDGWDPAAGKRIIEKWVGGKDVFALAVNPSSEGLRGAIKSGLIKSSGMPVVGADGMLIGQYGDPWVWPIAASTHSVMHIMAEEAHARGALTFGIVWEGNYRFGVEGHHSFVEMVERLPGAQLVADRRVQGGSLSYKNEADALVGDCSESGQDFKKCDFVAVLLEPSTAAQWVKDKGLGSGEAGKRPRIGIGAPPPLFVNAFIRDCGAPCSNLWVWTSFKPSIPPFDSDPKVATYLSDLRAVSSSADADNPHVQGAYVGAELLVAALEQLGPAPTRAGLQAVLDQMTFDGSLTPPMTFTAGNHFAAVSAQAFEAVFNVNSFVNWRYTNSGFLPDNSVHLDLLKDD